MPTYEYLCKSCGERLEVVQPITSDPLTECPNCQGTLQKVFSPVGIVFKGGGFYKNDSRKSASDASSASSTTESGASAPAKTTEKSTKSGEGSSKKEPASTPSTSTASSSGT